MQAGIQDVRDAQVLSMHERDISTKGQEHLNVITLEFPNASEKLMFSSRHAFCLAGQGRLQS